MNQDIVKLETFFVYRCIGPDDVWGTIIGSSIINNLPNSDFVVKIFSRNEREAICKAKELYDKIHHHDSDKGNIKQFICYALNIMLTKHSDINTATEATMKCAVSMNNKFKEYVGKKYDYSDVKNAIDTMQQERIILEKECDKLRIDGEIDDNY